MTLASVSLVSDTVGIRQRPEYTIRSKQGSPCSSGFHILLVIHIFVFEVRKTNGNLLWTQGREGGTGANFYPLSCVLYYSVLMKAFIMIRHALRWSLKVVQNINNGKKTYCSQSKELRFNQKLCKGIRFNEYGNYTAVAKSKRNQETLNGYNNKLPSDLRIPPLSQTSNYYPQTTNLGEGQ
jgi:hypothetical protein